MKRGWRKAFVFIAIVMMGTALFDFYREGLTSVTIGSGLIALGFCFVPFQRNDNYFVYIYVGLVISGCVVKLLF